MDKPKETWKKLEQHAQAMKKSTLFSLFDEEKARGNSNYTLGFDSLYLDFSKNHITRETLDLLIAYANSRELKQKIIALTSGDIVNPSENRAALHTALRDFENHFQVDKSIHQDISQTRERMFALAQQLNSGELKNHQEKPFKHLVCLGIGGSYLGPKFVVDALSNYSNSSLTIHFLASVDPDAYEQCLKNLVLDECLFFIASKSFNTLEVLHNARKVKKALLEQGVTYEQLPGYFIAATANTEAALDFGCHKERILPLWDYIGGRFSLWSSIGFPIVASIGKAHFKNLLESAHHMDVHFAEQEFDSNMPVIMGLLACWYQVFLESETRAVIPYSHQLKTFPAFLQQLEMESLGKSVDANGKHINHPTGAIIWGSEGPNSQHAFHQLLMQGHQRIPCDFIVEKKNSFNQDSQNILLAQCFAQSAALAFGNCEQNKEKSFKTVQGNQASNTLLLDEINPESLGGLLALYEHKVFVQAVLLNINAFDQWGVELGKNITGTILNAISNKKNKDKLDPSSATLIKKLSH